MRDSARRKFLREWQEEHNKEMESDDDIENEEEIAKKEKTMARYLLQIEKPYWSDNIYFELDVSNLSSFYDRAKKDLSDIN
jgi:hypothetical protein